MPGRCTNSSITSSRCSCSSLRFPTKASTDVQHVPRSFPSRVYQYRSLRCMQQGHPSSFSRNSCFHPVLPVALGKGFNPLLHTQSIFFVASFPLPFYVLTKRTHVAFVQAVVGPLPVPHVLFLNPMPSNLVLCVHVQIPRGQPVLQGVRRHRRHPPLEGGLRRDG